MKSLETKLAEVKANPSSRAFIIADAKDADMAFGVRAPGPRGYLAQSGARPARFSPEVWTRDEFGYRNLPEFLDIIREITHQGLIDIMLMSATSTSNSPSRKGCSRIRTLRPPPARTTRRMCGPSAMVVTRANRHSRFARPALIRFSAARLSVSVTAWIFRAR